MKQRATSGHEAAPPLSLAGSVWSRSRALVVPVCSVTQRMPTALGRETEAGPVSQRLRGMKKCGYAHQSQEPGCKIRTPPSSSWDTPTATHSGTVVPGGQAQLLPSLALSVPFCQWTLGQMTAVGPEGEH